MQLFESAAFAAWPSAVSTDVSGWRLQLDRGYTKRANSLNSTDRSKALSNEQIDAIEALFRDRGVTPVFRLTSFSSVPEADAQLAHRGYRYNDLSLVMTRALSDADTTGSTDDGLAADAEHWLASYQAVTGQRGADQAIHLDILRRIAHPVAWAVHATAGVPVSCGMGVMVEQRLGLFNIATCADQRGQGLATRLCRAIMAWGCQRGAHTVFLQVVAANSVAVRLYEKLGFQVVYTYWYREGSL